MSDHSSQPAIVTAETAVSHVSIPREQLVFLLSLEDAFCTMSGELGSRLSKERFARYQARVQSMMQWIGDDRHGVKYQETNAELAKWFDPPSAPEGE